MGHANTAGVGDVAVQHGTVTIAKLVHVVGGRILLWYPVDFALKHVQTYWCEHWNWEIVRYLAVIFHYYVFGSYFPIICIWQLFPLNMYLAVISP